MSIVRKRLFQLISLAFAIAAAWHLVALIVPIDPSSPAWRHALFVAINLALVAGMLRRPRWFAIAFGALVLQQSWSHGRSLVAHARAGNLDAVSLFVLVALPTVLALLLSERRE